MAASKSGSALWVWDVLASSIHDFSAGISHLDFDPAIMLPVAFSCRSRAQFKSLSENPNGLHRYAPRRATSPSFSISVRSSQVQFQTSSQTLGRFYRRVLKPTFLYQLGRQSSPTKTQAQLSVFETDLPQSWPRVHLLMARPAYLASVWTRSMLAELVS
jgi:hypothetical protein